MTRKLRVVSTLLTGMACFVGIAFQGVALADDANLTQLRIVGAQLRSKVGNDRLLYQSLHLQNLVKPFVAVDQVLRAGGTPTDAQTTAMEQAAPELLALSKEMEGQFEVAGLNKYLNTHLVSIIPTVQRAGLPAYDEQWFVGAGMDPYQIEMKMHFPHVANMALNHPERASDFKNIVFAANNARLQQIIDGALRDPVMTTQSYWGFVGAVIGVGVGLGTAASDLAGLVGTPALSAVASVAFGSLAAIGSTAWAAGEVGGGSGGGCGCGCGGSGCC